MSLHCDVINRSVTEGVSVIHCEKKPVVLNKIMSSWLESNIALLRTPSPVTHSNIEARSPNYCRCVTTISITILWVCVSVFFPLIIRRGNHIFSEPYTWWSLICLAVPYVSTLCHKRHECLKMDTEHKIRALNITLPTNALIVCHLF